VETEFRAGAPVECTDGPAGRLRRLIVDPEAETVTHLVVDSQEHLGAPILVPRDQVAAAGHDGVRLRCTRAEFNTMDPFEEVMYTTPDAQHPTLGYAPSQYLYPAQGGLIGPLATPPAPPPIVEVLVPPGEVVVDRESAVEATDGAVGHVEDILTDPSTGRLTHLVVRSGHLWAAHSRVVPAAAIAEVSEGTVRLRLSRDDVAALPESKSGQAVPDAG
jgi:uncharacterized protein YrrD